jgi:formylglycine-generating enzyme required for sulfatase activity
VKAGRILGKMHETDNKLNIVILDACRDNPFKRSFRTENKGLAQMDAPKGTIIAYATSPGSVAADGEGRNGVYTKHLLKHLGAQRMSVLDIFRNTGLGVMQETRDRQIPWMSSTPVPPFFLASSGAVVDRPGISRTTLSVSCNVDGAVVYVDGRQVGRTPLQDAAASPGERTVRVEKSGYDPYQKRITIDRGRAVSLYVDLSEARPRKARLFVETDPSDATVRILNISPRFYQGMDLDPGRYEVEVSASGYRTSKKWVDLRAGEDERIIMRLDAVVVEDKESKFTNNLGMTFVYIRPGSLMMGSPSDEPNRDDDERQHQVRLTRGFYMQTTEVTQGQWKQVMGTNPSHFKNCGDDCPVEWVFWNDCQEFIRKLNQMEGTDKYRLPTEAEWEYACRAGTDTPFSFGRCLSTDEANYDGRYPMPACSKGVYRKTTVPVASFSPNAWGLYDMHGNVWEWCEDWYGDYPSGSLTDPTGPSSGARRVFRGGSWGSGARSCRSAFRSRSTPGLRSGRLGFRLARDN